ncbi:hypothetical protein Q3A66_04015 [Hymenobacter sp. BT770]|uniref:hypothetical protein n=1 Tax=Hymenobacter sp. BT770 TaxID=2886942 RepID=UPI001D10E82E|nr:hypothetical protein [Hymenobacter sp. BT770]MCC3153228.1 hypothetical protein [Hymenobacter sp. BT770]MDO3414223.1 hypothetical protein [Hymenobacter sp. BT770]
MSVGSTTAQKASTPTPSAPYSAAGKTAKVYTTAANTPQRLAAGDALAFQQTLCPLSVPQ